MQGLQAQQRHALGGLLQGWADAGSFAGSAAVEAADVVDGVVVARVDEHHFAVVAEPLAEQPVVVGVEQLRPAELLTELQLAENSGPSME